MYFSVYWICQLQKHLKKRTRPFQVDTEKEYSRNINKCLKNVSKFDGKYLCCWYTDLFELHICIVQPWKYDSHRMEITASNNIVERKNHIGLCTEKLCSQRRREPSIRHSFISDTLLQGTFRSLCGLYFWRVTRCCYLALTIVLHLFQVLAHWTLDLRKDTYHLICRFSKLNEKAVSSGCANFKDFQYRRCGICMNQ